MRTDQPRQAKPGLPADPKEAVKYLNGIVEDQQRLIDELVLSLTITTHVAPTRPKDGMIRRADGTDWNPGSGAGLYQYRVSAWVKVG